MTDEQYFESMVALDNYHYDNCVLYKDYIDRYFPSDKPRNIFELPFFPVRFFKHFKLASVPETSFHKTIYSSGTSGQPSEIILDSVTAAAQSRVLAELAKPIIGTRRKLMLVFDKQSVGEGRNHFSARTAGINGFRLFSKKIIYLINEDGSLKLDLMSNLSADDEILFFGFTSEIWGALQQLEETAILRQKRPYSTLIHGGGWKKLESVRVSREEFRSECQRLIGVDKIVDYYGMVEQVGSVYFECSAGYYHNTRHSKIIIRDPLDLRVAKNGEEGLVQTISLLPVSYPGHSLLTEDRGIQWSGKCGCGSDSPRTRVLGRFVAAELRGCSDAVNI